MPIEVKLNKHPSDNCIHKCEWLRLIGRHHTFREFVYGFCTHCEYFFLTSFCDYIDIETTPLAAVLIGNFELEMHIKHMEPILETELSATMHDIRQYVDEKEKNRTC